MAVSINKVLVFGAGKIGRSFIGPVFYKGGYELVFIDIDNNLIDELNIRKYYDVIIKSEAGETSLRINNIRGVHLSEKDKVINEISTAGIMAVSVGINGLESVFPLMAAGLLRRYLNNREYPLDIIIAENIRDGSDLFRKELGKLLPVDYPINQFVGLIETSIGKMVPIMKQRDLDEDRLRIFAEPYNTLIVDKRGFRNPIPEIPDIAPKDNIRAWVDRKLFIHNLGHVTTAYSGFLFNRDFVYIWETLRVKSIYDFTRNAMLEASEILMKKHPGVFSRSKLDEHIDDLLDRFGNTALGDTIFRVGCDLHRKLGANDRLAGAIKTGLELDLPYYKILFVLICGCYFRAVDEQGRYFSDDAGFLKKFDSDVIHILGEVSGFDKTKYKSLFDAALKIDRSIHQFEFDKVLKEYSIINDPSAFRNT